MKKSRDLGRTRSEILQVTFLEVFTRGYQGVSIDDIVKKTSLTKGALYHQFPTKLDLGYALVEEVITPMIIERWIAPLHAFDNPLDGVMDIMDTLMGKASPEELKRGCPLNNLVQEMSPVDAGFKERLGLALNLWIDELNKHLKRGQKAGHIKKGIDTRNVAQFIVMAHEGFYGMIKGIGSEGTYKVLSQSLRSYLETIKVS